jgi:acetylornithine deacetylase
MDELYYDAVDLLKRLIATPRVSRDEAAAADLMFGFLEAHGLKPTRVKNNVWAVAGSFDPTRKTLLLNSHLDTVKAVDGWTRDPWSPDEDDDKLYGLGSNDAGASLVTMAATAVALKDEDLGYNLIFAASAEEEVSGADGMSLLITALPKIDMAIVGEPTGMNPAIAEKGLMVIDATVHGVSGHAARGEGINAIDRAVRVIETLRNMTFPAESPTLGPIKITVTGIHAGTQHNVVPDICTLMIDVRTTDAFSNAVTLALMRDAVNSVFDHVRDGITSYSVADVENARPVCELTPRSLRLNPSSFPADHPIVQRLEMMGFKAYGSPTLSDQALMPWQSLKVGPGDSARSHTADEFIRLSELRQALSIYPRLLTGLSL